MTAAIILTGSVGSGGVNQPRDVRLVQQRLNDTLEICAPVSGECDGGTIAAIRDFQAIFLRKPDGLINIQGNTLLFLGRWSVKSIGKGVDLRGSLRKAWDMVSPILPDGSYCASGFRSPEDQRRILHNFFSNTFKSQIIKKYGAAEWESVWANRMQKESRVLEMVRGVGQAIAAPGKSMHQQGRAIDVGGPSTIDDEQVRVIKMVARANPTVFSGMVLKERNGCVHFEIR